MPLAKKFNLIVAACENGGIGYKGILPWNLRGDMKQFARLTSETSDPSKRNAVLMGRRTWHSIPEKNRPLKNRINVIVTNTLKDLDAGVYAAGSVEDAVALLESEPMLGQVETIWVIGGETMYKYAMASGNVHRVYFTRILANFDCDVHFPVEDLLAKMKRVEDLSLPQGVQDENGIKYEYHVYENDNSKIADK